LFDDFVRVYFSCRPKRDANGQFVSYSAYVDLDRKNLFNIVNIARQPILTLGKKGCFDEFGTYPVSVMKMDDEIWAYYAGWTRCSSVPFNVGVGLAKSTDNGETFERYGDGPILPYTLDEPFTISGPKIRKFNNKYYLFYVAGRKWLKIEGRSEISHRIRVATSTDGINWTRHKKDLISSAWDEEESQASPDVFYANGKYHMFFCGWVPKNFRDTKNRKIGYASSTDLVNWVRDDSKAGIEIASEEDAFDNEMVAYPHVFELDGKTYMLYLGNQVGRYGFGLAELTGELR
jgi:sucrose-6-phosphate hydrolase SacC (GH32 family)